MTGLHLKIKEKFQDSVLEVHDHRGDETVVVKPEALMEVACWIKQDSELAMNVLMDLTAVDRLGMKLSPRFEVVYHFYSLEKNHRLRVKVQVEEGTPVSTLTGLWPAADWFEREVWDMFGIHFEGHPHLKRILLYEEFLGHPLRKDYPYDKRQPLIGPKN